jgi:DNA polymerase-3 subunit delta
MTLIRNFEADRKLAHKPADIVFFLVFGADAGLIAERVRRIVRLSVDDASDPFQLVRLDGDDIAADPLKLVDEANTIPMFGGRRAVWVEAGAKTIVPALERLFSTPPIGCAIVVEAGALKKGAPLRDLFERAKNAYAVECYPDSREDLERLIESEARALRLAVEPDAQRLLVSLLGEDRAATRSELSKLLLYAHGEKHVTYEHVEAVVADASTVALDNAINGAFGDRLASLDETIERVYASGGDHNLLVAGALRHAATLHKARLDIEAGVAPEQAALKFGKAPKARMGEIVRQLRIWSSDGLAEVIVALGRTAAQARGAPRLARASVTRMFWEIARRARSRKVSP